MKRPIEGVIEDVIVQSSKVQPIIVNFQNGDLKDEEAKKMACGLLYDQKKKKTVLALSNGHIVYKGYKPNVENELTHTMLVLHNRRTGKVRLVQVERWQVSPVLQKPKVEDSNDTMDDKVSRLNKQFGSKKVKRRTEQYERLKVNIESVKKDLENTVSNVEIDREDLSNQLGDNDAMSLISLPECNREAKSVTDVYNIYDIIPQNKLETLHETALEVLKSNAEGKSKFFARTLQQLKSDPDNVKKVSILIYIEAVCSWLNMPIKDAKKRGIVVCPTSEEVNSYVVNTYSLPSLNGKLRPTSMRDKGTIHCIILALAISNFTLNLELFSTILSNRMGLKKLAQLARIIGALPNKDDKNVITLKVPLPAQVAVVKKAKKKQS